MNYFQVQSTDIKNLKDIELTKLLSILLYSEAKKFGLVQNSVSVALNITVADGGEDGQIKWGENIDRTDWIPNRYTLYQVKATDMPPSACKKEVITKTGDLKPNLVDLFNENGTYILFHNRELNQSQITARINAFKKSIGSVAPEITPIIEIYDACKIAEWCNNYASAITAVWGWNGKHILPGCKTLEDWSGHKEFQNEFISSVETEQIINDLREHLQKQNNTARIVGLPGKGKTRLALEVFRNDKGNSAIELQALNRSVVYADAAIAEEKIVTAISSWRNLGMTGIIIIDNCDLELHKTLKSEIEHIESKFSLLTIDYNYEKPYCSDPLIHLDEVKKEVIEGILKNSYPEINSGDLERIVLFADGFPSIATLLAEARINEFDNIGSIQDSALIEKLLWGRDKTDTTALKVIEACAVFEYLGFDDEKEFEMKYVAKTICGLSEDEFYEKCQYFIRKKIMVKQGRYIKLVPKTLAITLAAQWWEKCRPEKAQVILTDPNLPPSLVEQLCNQISKLHFLEKAKELTTKLCGIQAPFGKAEILVTEIGSRIFCSLVEIDPIVTSEVLTREFGTMFLLDLKKVKSARRNLVRALEKLCFWENTFLQSAKVLGRFAAAENESWSNNATGQFLQLFHFVLSGTQADFSSRILLVKWALSAQEREIRELGVEALNHALKAQGFSRMLGSEQQGSRPSQSEWAPKNYGEIYEYWDAAFAILSELILEENELSDLASEKIAEIIIGLINSGYVSSMDSSLKAILIKYDNYWPDLLDKLNIILKYKGTKMPEHIIDIIKSWKDQLMPNDLIKQIQLLVCNANSDYIKIDEKNGNSSYIDAAINKVNDLVEIVYPEQIELLEDNLNILLVNEQKQTLHFGKELSNKMIRSEIEGFLYLTDKKILNLLLTENSINFNFLGGILCTLQSKYPELLKSYLENLDKSKHRNILCEIIRYIEVDEMILDRLLEYLNEKIIEVNTLYVLAYGWSIKNISEEKLLSFLNNLLILEKDTNQIIVWKIFYRYYLNVNKISFKMATVIIDWFETATYNTLGKISTYEVNDVLEQIYKLEIINIGELTEKLVNKIISILRDKETFQIDSIIQEYLFVITKHDAAKSWDLISQNLIEANELFKYRMVHIVGTGWFGNNTAPISNIPVQLLIEWAESNEKAPRILAEVYPVDINEEKMEDSFIHWLIKEYGTDELVLKNIDRQLRSFSWSGSLIPYYEKLIEFYKNYTVSEIHLYNWASVNINDLNDEIKRENIREDEQKLF